MSRTPEARLQHSVEIEIPFHDVDMMEVAWHGHYVKYFEIARCALLDQFEGQGDLNRLTRELHCEGQVSSVCSAVIYDYLFQAVRLLVRRGFDEASIQTFLDQELLKIGDEAEAG